MYEFNLPDYKNSIVNLMSSISQNFGKKHKYRELKSLKSSQLKKYKNIILIIIDGLGYNYLIKQKDSFLLKNLKEKISSTFLPTTACANTVFSLGYPPQQHALTGWDINLKETGAITTILPFIPRYGGVSLEYSGIAMENIIDIEPFHKGFNCKSFTLIDKSLADTAFTRYISKNTEIIPAKSYKNIFTKIKNIIKAKSRKRRFIHAYFPEFDTLAHINGIKSRQVKELFYDLDRRIEKLSKLKNTKIIITADHGMIDTSAKKQIWVEKVPGLKQCLTIPLAGEPRTRDCFVGAGKVKDFKKIVKTKLSRYCWCYKGEKLIKDNFYGLGKPSKKLLERVGDYVLIMKKNYVLFDKLANYEKPEKFNKGVHGGLSDDELYVPLIVI